MRTLVRRFAEVIFGLRRVGWQPVYQSAPNGCDWSLRRENVRQMRETEVYQIVVARDDVFVRFR
jgi:hypothetical protein